MGSWYAFASRARVKVARRARQARSPAGPLPPPSTVELFAAFSAGKISASQLERLRMALTTLDARTLNGCALRAFEIASEDEDVYDRAEAMAFRYYHLGCSGRFQRHQVSWGSCSRRCSGNRLEDAALHAGSGSTADGQPASRG